MILPERTLLYHGLPERIAVFEKIVEKDDTDNDGGERVKRTSKNAGEIVGKERKPLLRHLLHTERGSGHYRLKRQLN